MLIRKEYIVDYRHALYPHKLLFPIKSKQVWDEDTHEEQFKFMDARWEAPKKNVGEGDLFERDSEDDKSFGFDVQVARRKLLQNNVSDQSVLLSFKQAITSDPNGTLQEWNTSANKDHCSWVGVLCDNNTKQVIAINITGETYMSESIFHTTILSLVVLHPFLFVFNEPLSRMGALISRSESKHRLLANSNLSPGLIVTHRST